jgi:hypothetical protein
VDYLRHLIFQFFDFFRLCSSEIKEVSMSEQLGLTIIGLIVAIVSWIVNQVFMKRWEIFRTENRDAALNRLERAYQPLYYLTGVLILKWKNGEDVSKTKQRLEDILEHHGHLLSKEIQNFGFACLFMKDPDLNSVVNERKKLVSEIEKLKNLVYPSYKIYEQYHTSSLFGKMKIFWLETQYRLFSLIVTLAVILLLSYFIVKSLTIIIWIGIAYLIIGSIFYLTRDYMKARKLQGKDANHAQKR